MIKKESNRVEKFLTGYQPPKEYSVNKDVGECGQVLAFSADRKDYGWADQAAIKVWQAHEDMLSNLKFYAKFIEMTHQERLEHFRKKQHEDEIDEARVSFLNKFGYDGLTGKPTFGDEQ